MISQKYTEELALIYPKETIIMNCEDFYIDMHA
jgi:hypothetical protein